MGLEGCQRLMQFTHLLWCGRRVVKVIPSAQAEDGHENRPWGRDAERHEDGYTLLRGKAVIRPRRLGNAERRTEGRRCLIAQKVVHELIGSVEEEYVFVGYVLEETDARKVHSRYDLRAEGTQKAADALDLVNT